MSGHARPALDVLAELRRGRLAQDLTDELADLIRACQQTGKPGELTLKLKVKPEKANDYDTPQIEVTDTVGTRKPRVSVQPSRFFLTDDGRPVRRDPNQDEFPSLREVPTDPAADSAADPNRKAN